MPNGMPPTMNNINQLLAKYNIAAPRYTSYPTVPHWDNAPITSETWEKQVTEAYKNTVDGVSLYIHLPYCESLCTYCGCNTRITVNHAVEKPYIDALLKEWKMYSKLLGGRVRIKEIHLGGGTPTFFSADNLERLISEIISTAELSEQAEQSFEAHPANTTFQHLSTLYHLGFNRLSLGIQDFDPSVQEIINRTQSFHSVWQVTHWARALGYTSVNFDLVYGLPLQTPASMAQTLRHVVNLKPDRIAFYSYAHVPWIKPGQRKFTEEHLPAPAIKQQLYQLGRQAFEQAGYREIGMDHFALPTDSLNKAAEQDTLHRNFMGYTTANTQLLIGLGASSISDTWTCFAQNEKQVERYLERVNTGEFPIFKGHLLSEEDKFVRRHILNIMTTGTTEWTNPNDPIIAEAIKRLQIPEEDGLVILNPRGLEMTAIGQPFLRNICMAFDDRFWKQNSSALLFSQVI